MCNYSFIRKNDIFHKDFHSFFIYCLQPTTSRKLKDRQIVYLTATELCSFKNTKNNNTIGISALMFLGAKYALEVDFIDGSPEMYQDPNCTISENITTFATLKHSYGYNIHSLESYNISGCYD